MKEEEKYSKTFGNGNNEIDSTTTNEINDDINENSNDSTGSDVFMPTLNDKDGGVDNKSDASSINGEIKEEPHDNNEDYENEEGEIPDDESDLENIEDDQNNKLDEVEEGEIDNETNENQNYDVTVKIERSFEADIQANNEEYCASSNQINKEKFNKVSRKEDQVNKFPVYEGESIIDEIKDNIKDECQIKEEPKDSVQIIEDDNDKIPVKKEIEDPELSPEVLIISSPTEALEDDTPRNIFEESNIFNQVAADIEEEPDDEHNLSDDFKIGLESESNEPIAEESEDLYSPINYEEINEVIYLIDKKKSRSSKEVRRMQCECPFEPDDPTFIGCDETCLNRLLMIECNNRCPTGEFCTNKNFTKGLQYKLEVFKAGKKGWGLKTTENISKGAFIIEYCGEVVDYNEFHNRTQNYAKENIKHYYFMTLKTNEIIDATKKGHKSRFINHSCDPNCVTQKWTVNGWLRVGFFALRHITSGEELSFDYQFQRYGEKPQDCFCGADKCRGVIGTEQINVLPSYIDKIYSPSSASKKKHRKDQIKEFYESEYALELNEILGSKWELRNSNQTLELIRLMVKCETLHERQELLKILQSTSEMSALKAFVRFKGLSLLWSWMVDAPEEKQKYKKEILKTLNKIPIPNKNELDDSKLLSIVMKWATPPSPASSKMSISDEDTQSGSDTELRIDEGGSTSQDDSSKEDSNDSVSSSKKKKSKSSSDEGIENMEEGELSDENDNSLNKKSKKKSKKRKSTEKKNERREEIAFLSASLIEDWKTLKEVFRIPKKSHTPEKRVRDNSNCETPSPTISENRFNGVVQNGESPMQPDSTFLTPEEKEKQIEIHKGIGAFLNKAKEIANKKYPSSINHHSDSSRSDRHNRRNWRKSPDHNTRAADTTDSREKEYPARLDRERRLSGDSERNYRREEREPRNSNNIRIDPAKNKLNQNKSKSSGGQQNNQKRLLKPASFPKQHPPQPTQPQPLLQPSYPNNNDSGQIIRPLLDIQPQYPLINHQNQPPLFPPAPMPPLPPPAAMPPVPLPPPMFPPMPGNQMAPLTSQPPMIPPLPTQPYNPVPVSVNSNQSTNYNGNSNSQYQNSPVAPPTYQTSPAPAQPSVSTLNVVNQLQLLLSAERLKNASQSSSNSNSNTPDNRNVGDTSPKATPSSPSPRPTKPVASLPPHWKTATDAEGRMYYYHALTRQTSWDPPPMPVKSETDEDNKKNVKKRPSGDTPVESPPMKQSPRIVAADTTNQQGPRTPPSSSSSAKEAARTFKIKETFKSKVSSVVVNCLNAYQKVDCKQGRIKSSDDFKFLARKLTHGLVQKEIQRIKKEELLSCNDSVKMKIKEYIRNYMKKFGQYYVRS